MKQSRLNSALWAAVVASAAVGIASARPVSFSHIAAVGDSGVTDTVQHDSPERMRQIEKAQAVIARNKEKIRKNPDDVQAHKALGEAYLFLEQYENAFASYKEVIRLRPDDAEAHRGIGEAHERVWQFAKARDFYREAVRLNPKFARAQIDLGKTLVTLFQYKDAIAPLKEGIRLKARGQLEHNDYLNLGEAYLNTGQYKDAVAAYRQALEVAPHYDSTHTSIAEAYNGLKQYEDAIASAGRVLKQSPNDRNANRVLGDSYAGMGRYDKAVEYYKESIRVSANRYQVEALLGLGLTYMRMERDEEALAVFQKGIQYASTPRQFAVEDEIKPWLLTALYFAAAQADLNLGRGQIAAEATQKYIEIRGWSDANAAYAALMSYFGNRKAGHDEVAQKVLKEASLRTDAKIWPAPVFQYLRGDLKEEGLLASATDNDKMTEARAYVGMSLVLGGRLDAARPHLEWVIKNGNRDFIEYALARSELRRITKGP